ncbi:MAG: nuclear transport factor 2 family protein [Paracoccaceae bacterium]|nr:nuclear transport factor 2 family protein [Paracoccaceae bacterium]
MAIKDEMQAVCDAYVSAYRAGDAPGCAASFAEDGMMYSVFAPPAVGRAAIAATHRDWVVDGAGKTLTVTDAGGAGDVAWFLASFAEGEETGEGFSLAVCERKPGGTWLIRACSLTAAT